MKRKRVRDIQPTVLVPWNCNFTLSLSLSLSLFLSALWSLHACLPTFRSPSSFPFHSLKGLGHLERGKSIRLSFEIVLRQKHEIEGKFGIISILRNIRGFSLSLCEYFFSLCIYYLRRVEFKRKSFSWKLYAFERRASSFMEMFPDGKGKF